MTLTQCLQNVLHSPTGSVKIIYAGATFQETGSWILSDSVFSANDFYELVKYADLDAKHLPKSALVADNIESNYLCKGHRSISEHLSSHDIMVHLYTEPMGNWLALKELFSNHSINNAKLELPMKKRLTKKTTNNNNNNVNVNVHRFLFHFSLNTINKNEADNNENKVQYSIINYLKIKLAKQYQYLINNEFNNVRMERNGKMGHSLVTIIGEQDPLDTVGVIQSKQPTMYILPSGQGDCALLSINGNFTMLLDTGFLPTTQTFWPMVKHLQQLNTVLVNI